MLRAHQLLWQQLKQVPAGAPRDRGLQTQAMGSTGTPLCERGSVCVNSNPPPEPSEACLSAMPTSNVHPHIKALSRQLASYSGKQGKTDFQCVLFTLTCF